MTELVLRTDRLLLRAPTEADAAEVWAFERDEFSCEQDVLDYIHWLYSRTDTCFMFYIWLAETGEAIGRMYLQSKIELDKEVEIGYGLYEKFRGKGYATEAAKAVVRFAFQQGSQEVLAAIVKPENRPSRRMVEKVGFLPRGTRMVLDLGEMALFDYFQLTRDQWSAQA